ncbi:MAG: DUF547 domain-containing protein [Candidatus Omnitrophica bacterium]|nr:DUF547 domain-containing protein [Candidatus Omnitrophota bacterium]
MAPSAAAASVDHTTWDRLLRRHVTEEGLVDYGNFLKDRDALDKYLAGLATADVSQLSREAQLAFWINAYNACVIQGVLTRYPIQSVRPIRGFFDRERYPVAGRSLTIDEIAAQGKAVGDWRLHMAIVCASRGCPPLRNEAYVPDRLEAQLADQTRRYLADPARGLRVEARRLWVSKIFTWGRRDIVPGGRLTAETLRKAIEPYVDPAAARELEQRQRGLTFIEYDWALNDAASERGG